MNPPAARLARLRDLAWAGAAGIVCHASFVAAVAAMMATMLFGMSRAFGRVPAPWGFVCDALLLVQFPVLHSLLLTPRGGAVLKRMAPGRIGGAMSSTTYVVIASWQTLALFLLWTPSGVIWWQAKGAAWVALCGLNVAAWLFLLKAIVDAGLGLQTGFLGWWAVARNRPPRYPPMPQTGLFRGIRQPIYLGFALTLWTVPTWTPDQLVLALSLGGYCLLGPRLKEARFLARYGEAFEGYRRITPYWVPRRRR